MQRKYRVILGSQSPRRQELLRGLGIDFEVKTIYGQEELFPQDLPVEQIPQYLAVQKAEALGEFIDDDTLLITADTIVTLDGGVFGKPKDRAEAHAMLRTLSAATHEVITGVCVTTAARREVFASSTRVTFGCLTDDEIYYYIDKYRPFDKAGAYGIQEWIGFVGVERIEGSFYNVMGLPVQRIYNILKSFDTV